MSGTFHPDIVLERLRKRSGLSDDAFQHSVHDGIPDEIKRLLSAELSDEERKALERPQVVFMTSLTRESPDFSGLFEEG
jgi:hypothetical protein